MGRVEKIICGFDEAVVRPLTAVIQPNYRQRQDGKRLIRKRKLNAAEEHEVYIRKREQLHKPAAHGIAPKSVKRKQRQNARRRIVHTGNYCGGKLCNNYDGAKHLFQVGGYILKRPNAA